LNPVDLFWSGRVPTVEGDGRPLVCLIRDTPRNGGVRVLESNDSISRFGSYFIKFVLNADAQTLCIGVICHLDYTGPTCFTNKHTSMPDYSFSAISGTANIQNIITTTFFTFSLIGGFSLSLSSIIISDMTSQS
jgi:hypothetical protein